MSKMKPLSEILNRHKSFSSLTEDQALVKLWRVILHNLNVTEMSFERMLNDYLEDPRNAPDPEKGGSISQARTNMLRQLTDGKMTFKTLIRALRMIRVERADLIVRTHRRNGLEVIEHSLGLDLRRTLPKSIKEVDEESYKMVVPIFDDTDWIELVAITYQNKGRHNVVHKARHEVKPGNENGEK